MHSIAHWLPRTASAVSLSMVTASMIAASMIKVSMAKPSGEMSVQGLIAAGGTRDFQMY